MSLRRCCAPLLQRFNRRDYYPFNQSHHRTRRMSETRDAARPSTPPAADAAPAAPPAPPPERHAPPPRPTHFVALRLPPASCVHRSIAALHAAFDAPPMEPLPAGVSADGRSTSERDRWRHALYGLDRAHLTLAVVSCELPAAVAAMTDVVDAFFRRHGYHMADSAELGGAAATPTPSRHFRLRFPCRLGNFGGNRVVFVSPELDYSSAVAALPHSAPAASPPSPAATADADLANEAARFVAEVAALRRDLAAVDGVIVVSGGNRRDERHERRHHHGAAVAETDSPVRPQEQHKQQRQQQQRQQMHDIHVTLAKIGRRNFRRLPARRIPHDLIQIAPLTAAAAGPLSPAGDAAVSLPNSPPTAPPTGASASPPAQQVARPDAAQKDGVPSQPAGASTAPQATGHPRSEGTVRVHLPPWDDKEIVALTEGGLFTMDWDRVLGNWAYVPPQQSQRNSRTASPAGSASGGSPHTPPQHRHRHRHHHRRHWEKASPATTTTTPPPS